jgi:hypothetical protein
MAQPDPDEENARIIIQLGCGLWPSIGFVYIFLFSDEALANTYFRLILNFPYLAIHLAILAFIGGFLTLKFPNKYSVAPYALGLMLSHAILLGLLVYKGII